jgi:nitric oxide reductase NorQ protein
MGLGYLRAGYPINLAGPAGTGKTTLALHLAAELRQPATLIHGDDEFGSSDLVGNDHGFRKSKLIDNFIHSVVKTEETMRTLWMDNRLTTACRYGHVLIYDEFTRSRPEANNVLLSVLGEGLLNLPKLCSAGDGYLDVHPAFRAIFTSNPQEYAGVHKSQDALLDRLITIYMDHYDRQTEVAITVASGGVAPDVAERILDLIHHFRRRDPTGQRPSIRAAIMLAKVLAGRGLTCDPANPVVVNTCRDVLHLGNPCGRDQRPLVSPAELQATLRTVWGPSRDRAPNPWPLPAAPAHSEEIPV